MASAALSRALRRPLLQSASRHNTTQTVLYSWAYKQIDAEELGEGEYYPQWRLREMQQLGFDAFI